MKRSMTIMLAAFALLAMILATAGCGVGDGVGDGGTVSTTAPGSETTVTLVPQDTTTTVQAETTTTSTSLAQETTTVNVYYSRDEKMCAAARALPKTKEVGTAAMKALLEGPTSEEKAAGMVSTIPEGTTFLGLNIDNGIATVDLSKEYASGGGSLSMAMRLAEVVFTLTQFNTVEGVNFKLDGELVEVFGGEGIVLDHPVNRSDYEDLSPAILVESPTLGQKVGSPLRVYGTANVFEAVFKIKVVEGDLTLAEKTVTASSGTGTRGTFDVTIPFEAGEAGNGAIIVFSDSPKDGSHINLIETPLQLQQ